jgi:cellulose synthase/poly-beta-1,6-N-acetylglucosamine synthase-like glycosyltransferase
LFCACFKQPNQSLLPLLALTFKVYGGLSRALQQARPGRLRISLVVPHLNQQDLLTRCLAALAAGGRATDEVIVVDNGSREPPQAVREEYGVRLLSEAEPDPARNRGAAATTGDMLAFIDADCVADVSCLTAAEAVMVEPSAKILGGDVRIA